MRRRSEGPGEAAAAILQAAGVSVPIWQVRRRLLSKAEYPTWGAVRAALEDFGLEGVPWDLPGDGESRFEGVNLGVVEFGVDGGGAERLIGQPRSNGLRCIRADGTYGTISWEELRGRNPRRTYGFSLRPTATPFFPREHPWLTHIGTAVFGLILVALAYVSAGGAGIGFAVPVLVGLVVSQYLVGVSQEDKVGGCGGPGGGCAAVVQSAGASVRGLSLASLGVGYFGVLSAVCVLASVAGVLPVAIRTMSFALVPACLGAVGSMVYQIVVVRRLCAGCIAVQAASIAVALPGLFFQEGEIPAPPWMFVTLAGLAALGLAYSWERYASVRAGQGRALDALESAFRIPQAARATYQFSSLQMRVPSEIRSLALGAGARQEGKPELIVVAEPGCRPCVALCAYVAWLTERYPDSLSVGLLPLPSPAGSHGNEAVAALLAAADTGIERLRILAQNSGPPATQVRQEHRDALQSMIRWSVRAGVASPPRVLIDERLIPGLLAPQLLEAAAKGWFRTIAPVASLSSETVSNAADSEAMSAHAAS